MKCEKKQNSTVKQGPFFLKPNVNTASIAGDVLMFWGVVCSFSAFFVLVVQSDAQQVSPPQLGKKY